MSNNDDAWKLLLGGVALGTVAYLVFRDKKGLTKMPLKLSNRRISEHFAEQEFKQSSVLPALKFHELTPHEWVQLKMLVRINLQPARDIFGPLKVTGGGRPTSIKDADGKGFWELLTAKGWTPSKGSQHIDFSAADVTPLDRSKITDLFRFWAGLETSNQTILYAKKTPSGKWIYNRIHTSIRQPAKGGPYDKPVAWIGKGGKKVKFIGQDLEELLRIFNAN